MASSRLPLDVLNEIAAWAALELVVLLFSGCLALTQYPGFKVPDVKTPQNAQQAQALQAEAAFRAAQPELSASGAKPRVKAE